MTRDFAVTFDYRCPFARNAHEAVLTALERGADWNVRFRPFSLDQIHREEGQAPVWELLPDEWGTGTLALLYGITVRDRFPDAFAEVHRGIFAQRHDHGLQIAHADVLDAVIEKAGLDVDAVRTEVAGGRPLSTLAAEHTEAVDRWSVFGVPTFIQGDTAAFVRFMERDRPDDLERALELLEWERLNEFKRTRVPR